VENVEVRVIAHRNHSNLKQSGRRRRRRKRYAILKRLLRRKDRSREEQLEKSGENDTRRNKNISNQ